jgi:hypothetical protein
MNQPRSSNQPPSADTTASPQLKQEWAELRTLLLAPEQTQLTELRDRIDRTEIDARSIGNVLAEAIALARQAGRTTDRRTHPSCPDRLDQLRAPNPPCNRRSHRPHHGPRLSAKRSSARCKG